MPSPSIRAAVTEGSALLLVLLVAGCARQQRAEDAASGATREQAPAAAEAAGVRIPEQAPTEPRKIEPLAQRLVDQSLSAVRSVEGSEGAAAFESYLNRSNGILIFPNVDRDALNVGSPGAGGVLLAKQADGSWSYPAFFSIGPGRTGVSLDAARNDIVLFLMNDAAVEAALGGGLDSMGLAHGSLSLDEHLGPTGAAADVISLVGSDGNLSPGPSFGGTLIRPVPSLDGDYYGPGVEARAVLGGDRYSNPGARALVEALAPQRGR